MRAAGIIAEYDPFHNGHARHIAAVRAAGCTHVAVVLSGAFTQRGEPALLPKWQRAEMALACGADLVLELPVPWAMAPAELFAGGGVAGGNSEGLAPRMLNTSITNDASSVIGNGNSLAPLRSSGYGESSFRHHQPLSFGIAVRKEFAHGLSLESGVNYTLLRSDVRMQYTSDDVAQKLHFIGVPLRFNWQFLERGRFSLYMGAGGMVEKCVSARLGSETVDEPGVQWSALAAVGAQYRVGGMVGLYFEPEGSYYFTETGLRTSRTDSPLTLTLRLGVRLSF